VDVCASPHDLNYHCDFFKTCFRSARMYQLSRDVIIFFIGSLKNKLRYLIKKIGFFRNHKNKI
jgi:hypothetical protein